MSTVLSRMIQRGREPLSSLEPLIPPFFAPQAADYPPSAGLAESAELSVNAGLSVNAEFAPAPDDLESGDQGFASEGRAGDATGGAPRLLEASAVTGAMTGVVPAVPDPAPDGMRRPRTWAASAALLTPSPARDNRRGSGTGPPAPPRAGQHPPARRAAAAPAIPDGADVRGIPDGADVRGIPDVSVDAGTADGGGVFISIGHIQVHAAEETGPRQQRAPASAKPPFRPQMTLADFLARDTGQRGTGRR